MSILEYIIKQERHRDAFRYLLKPTQRLFVECQGVKTLKILKSF